MSKRNVPDKATDFDDELDVPTYRGDAATPKGRDTAGTAKDNSNNETVSFAKPSKARKVAKPESAKKADKAAATGSVAEADKADTTSVKKADKAAAAGTAAKKDKADPAEAKTSIFERAGRAQPQEIKPSAPKPSAKPEPTEVMSAGSDNARTEQYSDAPQRDYGSAQTTQFDTPSDNADADFAPRAGAATAGAATGGAAAYASADANRAQMDPAYAQDPALQDEPVETEEEREARLAEEQRLAEEKEGYRNYGRRGTLDFGLLLVRLGAGIYLLLAGLATFFTLGGGEGVSGLEAEFGAYAWATQLAIAVPVMQLVAGAFLILGLLTPVAAMVGLVVTGFTALHELFISGAGLDIFAWPESVWLSVVLFVIAVALQFSGPGFIALDFKQSWARRPLASSWIFIIVGVAVLVALWWFGAAVNPLP
ncbi:DoxX family protein [Corynebacterium camporealensis]|uniref:Putative membrane protein n=1 Tax=Corynebacterium camporealensis TaxID=161896 RepID=A0A0F6TAY5_9CORY|nr:DoxX family protein [Corynebacterium camporealensis]AKE39014.1 putative membrane protein [Corynebacterium camporealensis]